MSTSTIPTLLKELEKEAETTRKMLSIVPNDKYDWKPHTKSMNIRTLSTHLADIFNWPAMAVTTSELDFSKNPYNPPVINNTKDLLAYFEESLVNGKSELEKTNEDELLKNWTLRNGEQVYSVSTKAEVIRMSYSQIIHHRAQLGVFLRLLDVSIPGSYGPSADETF